MIYEGPDPTKMTRYELQDYVCQQNRIIRSLLREIAHARGDTKREKRLEARESRKLFGKFREEVAVPA